MEKLDLEKQISALPPVVLGGLIVVPMGLLAEMTGTSLPAPLSGGDTQAAAARARAAVMEVERSFGFDPVDRELERLGYDNAARLSAGRMLQRLMCLRNWLIGAHIVEFEQAGEERAAYGQRLMATLAERLQEADCQGLSARNLENCRQVALAYPAFDALVLGRESGFQGLRIRQTSAESGERPGPEKPTPPADIRQTPAEWSDVRFPSLARGASEPQLPWRDAGWMTRLFTTLTFSHLLEFSRIEDVSRRAFYELHCLKERWSVRELQRQRDSMLFMTGKKLIEVALPLETINEAAAREKSIRHGHPSTLHLWWTRRPLAVARAVIFTQMVDDPSAHPNLFKTAKARGAERQRLFRIIEDLVQWENTAMIEIPPRFGGKPPVNPESRRERPLLKGGWRGAQGLAEDVRYYGQWMRDDAEKRIGHLYPTVEVTAAMAKDRADLEPYVGKGLTVIAWLWARTVPSPDPAMAGAHVPLIASYWLCKKKGKLAWVEPVVDKAERNWRFEVRTGTPDDSASIEAGTKTGRGTFRCLLSDAPMDRSYLHEQGKLDQIQDRKVAVVAEGERSRVYLSSSAAQKAVGSGMAVYTRHARVLESDGSLLTVRTALALINQVLDEALAEQEGDFDADSRWALAWFEQHGFADGEYAVAETLSKAKNTSVSGLVAAGILRSKGGKLRFLEPSDLPANWDPTTDSRLAAWEIVHHLIRVLEGAGESGAAELVAKLDGRVEPARELAYRLYSICERKKRAREALAYNALVQSWPEIARLAKEPARAQASQGGLFEEDE